MKIVICGSISAALKIVEIKEKLSALNHEVIMPHNVEKYASGALPMESGTESVQNKIKDDLIRRYFNIINSADSILVVNADKNGKKNYIGGNAFLEMGYAYALNKNIFLLNEIPDLPYADEIRAMCPVVIGGDLSKIQ